MFRISYEKSGPSAAKIDYYNKIAAAAMFHIDWIDGIVEPNTITAGDPVTISTPEPDGQIDQPKQPDAILLTGRENFHDLHKAGYSFLVSENSERRLVALFSPAFSAQSKSGVFASGALRMAADFNWQASMICNFLKKALPKNETAYQFETIILPESFDQRLKAVIDGRYDIGIFALADLNNLIVTTPDRDAYHDKAPATSPGSEAIEPTSPGSKAAAPDTPGSKAVAPTSPGSKAVAPDTPGISALRSLQRMVLPLFECPPAFFQGTTALMFKDADTLLATALNAERTADTTNRFLNELLLLSKHGSDEAGIFSADLPAVSFTYLAGLRDGQLYEDWEMPLPDWQDKKLFATTEHMKDFFSYRFHPVNTDSGKSISFLASHKVAHDDEITDYLKKQHVWVAGTRTWYEMAKKGIWVEGSADGIGLGILVESWKGSFLSISKEDVEILTNTESALQWEQEGWVAQGVYDLMPELPAEVIKEIEAAEVIFWTSFQQYQACKTWLKTGLIHATPAGKTAELLIDFQPFVFPSIKAFRFFQKGK